METLRMVLPVFGGFRLASRDIEYGGYLIPRGWQVFWASNMTHMDESIFPKSSKFDPVDLKSRSQYHPTALFLLEEGLTYTQEMNLQGLKPLL